MRTCAGCGGAVEASFRYCPWCAAPQRSKLTEFFRADPAVEQDDQRALRVSRYLAQGSPRHVRFSVWRGEHNRTRVEAAVSIGEKEAARLARFLSAGEPDYREQHHSATRG
jgi:hypothetical protein